MSKTKYTIYWDCLEQFGISYQTRYYLIAKIKLSFLKHKNKWNNTKFHIEKSYVSNNTEIENKWKYRIFGFIIGVIITYIILLILRL